MDLLSVLGYFLISAGVCYLHGNSNSVLHLTLTASGSGRFAHKKQNAGQVGLGYNSLGLGYMRPEPHSSRYAVKIWAKCTGHTCSSVALWFGFVVRQPYI